MYNISDTEQFGLKGKEINFFIETNINHSENYIKTPNNNGYIIITAYNTNIIKNPIPVVQTINFINEQLRTIYLAHKTIKEAPTNLSDILQTQNKQWKAYTNYLLGLQTLIYLINKLLLSFVFSIEEIYLSNTQDDDHKKNYNYIKNIRDFINRAAQQDLHIISIYNKIIKSFDTEQLFKIISSLHEIYQSQNMFATFNIIGIHHPSIVAIEPINEDDYKFIYHNHSILQIIEGINKFLKEVEFFNEHN